MAKGQNLTRHQRGIVKRYYENKDTIMLQKLGEIVSDLYLATGDDKKTRRLWERAAAALVNTQVNPNRMGEVLKSQDVEALAKLVDELGKAPAPKTSPDAMKQASDNTRRESAESPGPAAAPARLAPVQATRATDAQDGGEPPASEDVRRAMKAFRKRLKLSRLDAESGLSRSPLSSGRKSSIVAIQPPSQFPRPVWEELVRQGRLKNAGRGFYQLAEE